MVGLADAIQSIIAFLAENELNDVVLVGHSYGGMIITGAADIALPRMRRLVYWNAFVPNNGESVSDSYHRSTSHSSMPLPQSEAMAPSSCRFRSGGKRLLTTRISIPRDGHTIP